MADPPFTLGMAPLKDYSSNPAARQKTQPPALAIGKPIAVTPEALELGIKKYLDDNHYGIEKDAAYFRKQIDKERMSSLDSHFEAALKQLKGDLERMKKELDLCLEKVLELKDKIPKEL